MKLGRNLEGGAGTKGLGNNHQKRSIPPLGWLIKISSYVPAPSLWEEDWLSHWIGWEGGWD